MSYNPETPEPDRDTFTQSIKIPTSLDQKGSIRAPPYPFQPSQAKPIQSKPKSDGTWEEAYIQVSKWWPKWKSGEGVRAKFKVGGSGRPALNPRINLDKAGLSARRADAKATNDANECQDI